MRILIVEDDREVAEYVGRCLEEEGNTALRSASMAEPGSALLNAAASTSSCWM